MARGATLLVACGDLSERDNGRDPAGASPTGSPQQLGAEFDPSVPPVFHPHRLASWPFPNLLLRFDAVYAREYIGGITSLSTKSGPPQSAEGSTFGCMISIGSPL
jgi:hypothetical protein